MTFFVGTLHQMLLLFSFMIIGFILVKMGILTENADVVISRLENYVFVPALIIHSFGSRCTLDNLRNGAEALVYSAAVLGFCILVAVLISPKLAGDKAEEGIFRYSIAVTNFGFMGNSLVQGLLGEEMLFRYLIFCLPMNVFIYSVGVIWLTAGKKKFTPKMMVNPMFFSVIIGAFFGISGYHLPLFLSDTISSAAACYSPLAMILTGCVIGKFDFRALFSRKSIYLVSALRLVLLPVFLLIIMRVLGVPNEIVSLCMFASAMPLGLNTIVFPAAYGGDKKIGAGMAVISNIMGIVTVPVLLGIALGT